MRLFLILVWFMKASSDSTVGPITDAGETNETWSDYFRSSARENVLEAFDLALEYCPNIHFCAYGKNTNSTDDYGNANPQASKCDYCFRCSCADDCVLFNSCCPDAPALANQTRIQGGHFIESNIPNRTTDIYPSTPVFSCESPVVPLGNRYLNYRFISSLERHYSIVDTCSDQRKNCAIAEHGELDDDEIDLKDFQIVSSSDGKTLYRNERCAACNGVTSIRR